MGRRDPRLRVGLDWRAPQTNGAPIGYYEVQDQRGHTQRCQGTSCDITGLENGPTYKFRVRAHNPVGFSRVERLVGPGSCRQAHRHERQDRARRARGDADPDHRLEAGMLKGGGEAVYVVRSSTGET